MMCPSVALLAQNAKIIYKDASKLYISGKLFATAKPYQRVDTVKYSNMPPAVKKLYTHSAGLAICFTSNSTGISARWCVTNPPSYPNLTPIASKGLNLYVEKDGQWQYAGVGRPEGDCNTGFLVQNMDHSEKKFVLYLPIYSELSQLEIGIDEGSGLQSLPDPFQKRVLVYGSSITQGAAASRSGLAYPAVLSRRLGYDFLNAGVSGSAKMEPEVIAMLNDIEADAYILDCIPNSTEKNIKDRAVNMIHCIQRRHPGKPVILLNSIVREQSYVDAKVNNMVTSQNSAIDSIAADLINKGTPDFYFINTKGFLGDDHEGTTDGIHPNDLGSYRFVSKLEPIVADILKKYF